MKKNKMMRIASVLLVAVLLSTCAISGTFAKYTDEATATDSAKVAKWGVEVTVGTDIDTDIFDKTYNIEEENYAGSITTAVSSAGKVVAPGTSGSIQFAITGKPEVATRVSVAVAEGWTDIGIKSPSYYPVKFSLTKNGEDVDDATKISLSKMVSILEGLDGEYEANSDNLAATYVLSWEWEFGDGNTDANDTILGNAAVTPVEGVSTDLSFSFTIRVDQID